MFIGEFSHTVDAKGRVSMPSKFREKLGQVFYATKGLDNCLFVFDADEWSLFEEKLKEIPVSNKPGRMFSRLFFGSATECTLDKQGRINLPAYLREYSSIDKNVKVVGVGTRIEIWSLDKWSEYSQPDNINYDDIEEQMAELGI